MTLALTPAQRKRIKRANVGWLDDGRMALPVVKSDTEDVARAIFANYDDELELTGQIVVEWCNHNAQYAYDHGCGNFCENPTSRMVWVASYFGPATEEAGKS